MAEAITNTKTQKRPISYDKADLLKAGTGRLYVVFGGRIDTGVGEATTTLYTVPPGKVFKLFRVTFARESNGLDHDIYDSANDSIVGATSPVTLYAALRESPRTIDYSNIEFFKGVTVNGADLTNGKSIFYQMQGYLE